MVSLSRTEFQVASQLDLTGMLKVDFFAGGGGVSCAIEDVFGDSPDYAVNHDPVAMDAHEVVHPQTTHMPEDVFKVDIRAMCKGRQVGFAWFSPDCRHFSKAKGGQPVSPRVRGLAWVMVKMARIGRPLVMCLENVEEFMTWGPCMLNEKGETIPDPARAGETFNKFVSILRGLGYAVEWKVLQAADHGAPTLRQRFFLVARCDGKAIGWPTVSHGNPRSVAASGGALKAWRTAAEILDWSIPVQSIFGRKKDLVPKSQERIAKGVLRYVLGETPFLVPSKVPELRGHEVKTAAWIVKHYSGVVGFRPESPLHTVTTVDHHGLVEVTLTPEEFADPAQAERCWAFITKFYSQGGQWAPMTDPMHTLVTKDRMMLVIVKTQGYVITDIGTRMLTADELFSAQGFPASRRPTTALSGKKLTHKKQVHLCGNSVPPPLAAAVIRAQLFTHHLPPATVERSEHVSST